MSLPNAFGQCNTSSQDRCPFCFHLHLICYHDLVIILYCNPNTGVALFPNSYCWQYENPTTFLKVWEVSLTSQPTLQNSLVPRLHFSCPPEAKSSLGMRLTAQVGLASKNLAVCMITSIASFQLLSSLLFCTNQTAQAWYPTPYTELFLGHVRIL